jgi:hypothetical protein
MTSHIILFNDAQALDEKLKSLQLESGADVDLVYAAPNRPARMKRWVSRNGWERLTMERARKMAVDAESLLIAKGASVHVHAVVGDALWEANARAQSLGAKLIDARAARYDLPTFQDAAGAAESAAAAVQATAQTAAQWSHALLPQAQPATAAGPKIIYKPHKRIAGV